MKTMTNHEEVHLFLAVSLLHRHGYEVLPIAVHVDEGIVAQLEQTSGFQPIYNGNNDGRRLEPPQDWLSSSIHFAITILAVVSKLV